MGQAQLDLPPGYRPEDVVQPDLPPGYGPEDVLPQIGFGDLRTATEPQRPLEALGPPTPAGIKARANRQAGMDRYAGMPEGYQPQTGAPERWYTKPTLDFAAAPEETRFLTPEQRAGVSTTAAPTQGTPYAPGPKEALAGQVTGGAFNAGAKAIKGVTGFASSPAGLALTALTAGAGPLAPMAGYLTSGAFLADMGKDSPEALDRLNQAGEHYGRTGDAQPMVEAVGDILSQAAFMYGMARHPVVGAVEAQGRRAEARANEAAIPGAIGEAVRSVADLRAVRDRLRAQREALDQVRNEAAIQGAVGEAADSVADLRAVRDRLRAQREALDQAVPAAQWRRSVNEMGEAPADLPPGYEATDVDAKATAVLQRVAARRRFETEPPRQGPVSPVFAGEAAPRARGLEDLTLPELPGDLGPTGEAPPPEPPHPLDRLGFEPIQPEEPQAELPTMPQETRTAAAEGQDMGLPPEILAEKARDLSRVRENLAKPASEQVRDGSVRPVEIPDGLARLRRAKKVVPLAAAEEPPPAPPEVPPQHRDLTPEERKARGPSYLSRMFRTEDDPKLLLDKVIGSSAYYDVTDPTRLGEVETDWRRGVISSRNLEGLNSSLRSLDEWATDARSHFGNDAEPFERVAEQARAKIEKLKADTLAAREKDLVAYEEQHKQAQEAHAATIRGHAERLAARQELFGTPRERAALLENPETREAAIPISQQGGMADTRADALSPVYGLPNDFSPRTLAKLERPYTYRTDDSRIRFDYKGEDWHSNGHFMEKGIAPELADVVKGRTPNEAGVKKLIDRPMMPAKIVGIALDAIEGRGKSTSWPARVVLEAKTGDRVAVQTGYLNRLLKDHPGADIYMEKAKKPGENMVFLKEGDQTVAALMPRRHNLLEGLIRPGSAPAEPRPVVNESRSQGMTGTAGMTREMREALRGPVREQRVARPEPVEPQKEPLPPIRAAMEFKDDLQRQLSPASRTQETRAVGGSIRHRLAEAARRETIGKQAMAQAKVDVLRLSPDERLDFVDRVERGEPEQNPTLEGYAKSLRQELDSRTKLMQEHGVLRQFIENYFPRAFKNVGKATEWIGGASQRLLEGNKAFLKRRTLPEEWTTKNAVKEGGLELADANPIDLLLRKLHDMDQFIAGRSIVQDTKDMGLGQFVPSDKSISMKAGYAIPRDPAFQVWGPPNVKIEESHDEILHERLESIAKDLGIEHKRIIPRPGGPMGVEGPGGRRVVTKFASDLGILTHELGHAIDDKFHGWDAITNVQGTNKTLAMKTRGTIQRELRELADQRRREVVEGTEKAGGKLTPEEQSDFGGYVRKKTEKMANMLDAYINHRDMMRKVAPTVLSRLEELIDAHPELKPLKDIQPTLIRQTHTTDMPTGGPVKLGDWAVPKEVAQMLDNVLSRGLEGSAAFRGFRAGMNTVVQTKLGWSAFHGTFSALTTPISEAALAFKYAARGDLAKAVKVLAKAPSAPVLMYREGRAINRAALTPGLEITPEIDAILKGGGRFASEYSYGMVQRFREALAEGRKVNAAFRAIPALTEYIARPLMEKMIPNIKTAANAHMAEYEVSRLGPDATPSEIQYAVGRGVDSVDNRFGQLIHRNLMWKKMLSDLMGVAVQAPGWNIGDVRELGGGLVDTAMIGRRLGQKKALLKEHQARIGEIADLEAAQEAGETSRGDAARLRQLKQRERMQGRGLVEEGLTHRMAFTMALPIIVGTLGGTLNFLMTGEAPKEMKDYFFPRTGRKREDGSDERISLPSYMKDVYSFAMRPVKTIENKLHPVIGSLAELAHNRDQQGTEIVHPDDPWYKMVGDVGLHLLKTYEPISISNIRQGGRSGDSIAQKAAAALGAPSAPRYITETPAQREMTRYSQATRGTEPRTKEQYEKNRALRETEQMIRLGRPEKAKERLEQAAADGLIGRADVARLRDDLKLSVAEDRFKGLPLDEKFKVYEKANPDEKTKLLPLLTKTIRSEQARGTFRSKSPIELRILQDKLRRVYANQE